LGKDVEFTSAEADHPEWGLRTAFLRDPDGSLLCLYESLATGEVARAE
jgi:hypothetical protein